MLNALKCVKPESFEIKKLGSDLLMKQFENEIKKFLQEKFFQKFNLLVFDFVFLWHLKRFIRSRAYCTVRHSFLAFKLYAALGSFQT